MKLIVFNALDGEIFRDCNMIVRASGYEFYVYEDKWCPRYDWCGRYIGAMLDGQFVDVSNIQKWIKGVEY